MAGTGGPRLLSSSQGLSPSRHLPQRSGGPLAHLALGEAGYSISENSGGTW